MKIFGAHLARFFRDESGATMVEYGLLVSILSVLLISMLTSTGDNLVTTFTSADDGLNE